MRPGGSFGFEPDPGSTEPIIGAAGRLTKVKGFDILIESAKILVESGRNTKVLIAGEGPEQDSLQSQIRETGLEDRIQLLGLQEDMSALYSACDVFVLSSRREGSPGVVLEAMASQRPVVATAVGGVPEIIEDGRSGILVPSGRADSLAGAVARLIDDKTVRRQIAERGRQRVVERFDLDQITARYEELYSGVLQPRRTNQPKVGSPYSQESPTITVVRSTKPAEAMTTPSGYRRGGRSVMIAGLLLVLALIGLRLVHLNADPPNSLWTESFGPFVDEGYKTLDARNLALFGKTHWNPEDDYPGWLPRSLITQLSFLAAFRILGQEIGNARLVTVFWFLAMLLIFLWATSGAYRPSTVYFGLLLLGTNLTLFAFSRLAIFEIPIAFLLLVALLTLKKLSKENPILSLAVVLLCLLVGAFGIKASALLYFLPVMAAVGLVSVVRLPNRVQRQVVLFSSIAIFGALLIYFFDFWAPRLDWDFARILRESLASPAAWAHPVLVAATFLAVGQGLYDDWRNFLSSSYRLSLVTVCVLGPLMLSLFSYNPLRYYVPILPVYILLVLEWLEAAPAEHGLGSRNQKLAPIASGAMLLVALVAVGLAFNRLVLGWIIPEQHADPSYVAPLRFTQVLLIAAAAALLIVFTPALSFIFRKRMASLVVLGLLLSSLLINATAVYLALTSPSLERDRVSREIGQLLPRGASIGGDWAPIFSVGTEIKTLYMNEVFNAPNRVKLVKPEYLLLSDTYGMRNYRDALMADAQVHLESAIYESEYKDRKISLHPLKYEPQPTSQP